jgi:ABC-type sulfate transport system substrate-binding protein
VAFLWTEQAQRLFVSKGFRSVEERLNEPRRDFGAIEDPFLVGNLGGWKDAKAKIIDQIWKKQILPEVGK